MLAPSAMQGPLGGYLNSLSLREHNELTGQDDHALCQMLLETPLPMGAQRLAKLIVEYTDPRCRKSRTLGVWHSINQNVERLLDAQCGGHV
jgi:hypothetical protein